MAISSLGIGSGVLTSDLLDKLVNAERKPTELRLDAQKKEVDTLISEFGKIKSAITELRLPARTLGNPEALNAFSASSSSSAVSAEITGKTPQRGVYNVDVTNLATSQSLATGTFADSDTTTLGTGQLTFEVGETTKNFTIDSSNNTLDGIAAEINDANIGVSASVVDTGSGYRLVFTAEETGTANSIKISAADGDGNDTDASGLSQLVFNDTTQNLTETVAAEDAQFSVNGISVTRSSNTVEGVVEGVTFTLNDEASSSVIVGQDTAKAADRVQEFVDKFNALQDTINELTKFEPETQEAGVFLGDATVRNISAQVRQIIGQVVPGLENASVRSMSEVGISTNAETGKLEFDSAKFQQKLAQNPTDVTALFAEQGRTSDSQIEFRTGSVNTKPGTYDVNISQLATQGSYSGSSALAATTTIDADNDEFTLLVDDSTSVSITLTQGDYTPQQLADEIQAQLDANAALQASGRSVSVSLDGSDQLQFSSGLYGSDSQIEFTSVDTNTAAELGLSVGAGTAGVDVAGTINGQTATGSGQILTANKDDDSAGIRLQVNGGATGDRGTVTYIEGVGEQMVDKINNFLSAEGAVSTKNEFFQDRLDQIAKDREQLETRIASFRQRLANQFAAADSLIAQFESTKQYLETQFASLAGNNSKK